MKLVSKFAIIHILSLILFLSCGESKKQLEGTQQKSQSMEQPVIMAYYVPERDYRPEKIPVEKLTHIIYSFTNVIDGEMKFREPETAGPK